MASRPSGIAAARDETARCTPKVRKGVTWDDIMGQDGAGWVGMTPGEWEVLLGKKPSLLIDPLQPAPGKDGETDPTITPSMTV